MHRTRFSIQIVVVAGFALVSQTAKSQQSPLSPTLIIGTTTVKLGMQKDAVVAVLSAQYVIRPSFPNCKSDDPICHAYILYETDNFPAGNLEFDKTGTLVRASVERLVGWGGHILTAKLERSSSRSCRTSWPKG